MFRGLHFILRGMQADRLREFGSLTISWREAIPYLNPILVNIRENKTRMLNHRLAITIRCSPLF